MGDLRKLIDAIEARGGRELAHETALIERYDRWVTERQAEDGNAWQLLCALQKRLKPEEGCQ